MHADRTSLTMAQADAGVIPLAILRRSLSQYPFLFALLLLVIALAINYALQDNLFELRTLNPV